MIERLDFGEQRPYNAVEAAIHLNRYSMVKSLCKGKLILDAACGEGYGSYLLKDWGAKEVFGLDIDTDTVKKAEHIFGSSGVKFQCHTVEELPFPDYYFDMVVSFETIEHLDHPEKFLQEIRRVLKPGGIIVLSCPNDPYYYKMEKDYKNPFHKRQYTYFDFKELTERYLGNHVDYYFGVAVNGFLNMALSKTTEPSEACSDNMLEMLNYTECGSALYLKQDRYINHWNCNYYVGIWGGGEKNIGITAAIHPREFFSQFEDKDIDLIKQIQEWEEKKKNQDEDIKQMYDVERLKTERLSGMNELLNKEISCLQQSFDRSRQELNAIQQKSLSAESNAKELQRRLDLVQGELTGIKDSKGWKMLMLLYKIEGFFRK